MFEGLLSSLTSLKPIAVKGAAIFFVVSSFLLFVPTDYLERIGLSELVDTSKSSISLLFVLCISILGVEAMSSGIDLIKAKIESGKYARFVKHHLSLLSKDEKEALKRYVDEDKSVCHFAMTDGVAGALEGKRLITRSSNLGVPGAGAIFPYAIQPVVLEEIKKNPKLIE